MIGRVSSIYMDCMDPGVSSIYVEGVGPGVWGCVSSIHTDSLDQGDRWCV